jgi:hypothetical protein
MSDATSQDLSTPSNELYAAEHVFAPLPCIDCPEAAKVFVTRIWSWRPVSQVPVTDDASAVA